MKGGYNKGLVIGWVVVLLICWLCPAAAARVGQQPASGCERKKGLIILVEFPDVSPPVSKDFIRERFHKLDIYVREMSYGKVCTDVDLSGWHRMPDPIARYAIAPANLQVDKSRVVKLVQDAVDAADGANDFSRYDFVVLLLGADFKQYGMVGLCGYPGMLGWKQDMVFKTRSGQRIPGGVAIFTPQAHLGTLFHDIAHVWGGVKDGKRVIPCLYDHDIQARHPTYDSGFAKALINMGYWDPLSCHFYKRKGPPPGVCSWTKLRLGWIDPDKVKMADPRRPEEILLGPLEDGSSQTLVIRVPLTAAQFYLIENRQPMGRFDSHLPGKGVLIMYADDHIDECRNGRSPVKLVDADPSEPCLQGAAFDIPGKREFVDRASNLRISIMDKKGDSYRIRVDQAR